MTEVELQAVVALLQFAEDAEQAATCRGLIIDELVNRGIDVEDTEEGE